MRFFQVLVVLALIVVVLGSHAARFLIVDNEQKSDAIVVLAGDTHMRPVRGLQLLRQGMAPRMFLDAEAGEQIYDQQLTDIAQKYVNSLPEANRISVCPIAARSTVGETGDVGRCLQAISAHRVLLVTSDFHTRRALAIFAQRLPHYQWSVAAASDPARFGVAWWTNREWAKVVFDEWSKLIWWEAVDRWRGSGSQ